MRGQHLSGVEPSRAGPVQSSPGLSVFADQAHKGLHLRLGDVLLQQFAVVVQQSSDGVLSQDVVADLALHHTELLGDVLLQRGGATGRWVWLEAKGNILKSKPQWLNVGGFNLIW